MFQTLVCESVLHCHLIHLLHRACGRRACTQFPTLHAVSCRCVNLLFHNGRNGYSTILLVSSFNRMESAYPRVFLAHLENVCRQNVTTSQRVRQVVPDRCMHDVGLVVPLVLGIHEHRRPTNECAHILCLLVTLLCLAQLQQILQCCVHSTHFIVACRCTETSGLQFRRYCSI